MSDQPIEFCPEERLDEAAALAVADAGQGLAAVTQLAAEFPRDPRLPYLEGSILLGAGRHGEAVAAMGRAVVMEPAFDAARFQLGFLRMMHRDAFAATEAWGPLLILAADDPLRLFTEGLFHLIRDEIEMARQRLQEGLERNAGHEALNREIRMIIDILDGPDGPPSRGRRATAAGVFDVARRRTHH